MNIEQARPADAPAVAALHASHIDEGFLSTLGPGFLTLLYRAMAMSPEAILLVARADGRPAGFVAGSAAPGDFYRAFRRRHGFEAALRVLARAFRPRVAKGLLETLRYMRREGTSGPELLAIAVTPSTRRSGLGSGLAANLEERLKAQGAVTLGAVVGSGNAAARGFYESLGFAVDRELKVHAGVMSIRYEKRF